MDELVGISFVLFEVAKVKIEQSEKEYRLDVEIPSAALRFVGDGQRRVEDGPLHEIELVSQLYFDDEGTPVPGVAMHVERGFPFLLREALLLTLADIDVGDVQAEDGVEGADDELFLAGFLEDLLESEVDHRVDVEGFSVLFHN